MKKPTDTGKNRTGIATSPKDSKRTIAGAEEGGTDVILDASEYSAEKLFWSRHASPVGTMPKTTGIKGMAKNAMQMMQGHKPSVFLDKLGERLAFERSGTRLYEALVVKFDASDPHVGGPTRADLVRIRDEELAHYAIIRDAMVKLGADPTAVTPGADITGVMSLGIVQVLNDPRTTFTQCLEAILVAELADNDGWVMLASLAEELGQDEIARDFRHALVQEDEHLQSVRDWLRNALRGQVGVDRTPPQPGARAT